MPQNPPFLLIILDGFGHAKPSHDNAITSANTPFFDYLWKHYPHTLLKASGTAVGLPPGVPGNSEAGHLAIGTGRVIKQPVTMLLDAIQDGQFKQNMTLKQSLQEIKDASSRLHIIGICSDAGIHGHTSIIDTAINAALDHRIQHIFIHAFLDGRDTPPRSAKTYLEHIDRQSKKHPQVELASICGRFYGMDRDANWERTQKAYDMLTHMDTPAYTSWQEALDHYYQQNITDEFIPPTLLNASGIIQENDGVCFTNIRPDRARQLAQAMTDPHFSGFDRPLLSLSASITPVSYGTHIKTTVLFHEPKIENTLTDVLLAHHKTVFEIAETEKYAHVSYFFNGNREATKRGETRILIPSMSVQTYEAHPCMSAQEITQRIIESLQSDPQDVYVINYANADMVGHSGNFNATVKAIECLDEQLKKLYTIAIKELAGSMLITADHGKAEEMFDTQSNQPKTAHTTNKVPCIFVSNKKNDSNVLPLQSLTDIAPYIIQFFDLPTPKEMK